MISLLLATAAMAAPQLPMSIQGAYCDIYAYTDPCDDQIRFRINVNGSVDEMGKDLYGNIWTVPWGTWSYSSLTEELTITKSSGWPDAILFESFGTWMGAIVLEGGFQSDTHDFDVTRIIP